MCVHSQQQYSIGCTSHIIHMYKHDMCEGILGFELFFAPFFVLFVLDSLFRFFIGILPVTFSSGR